MTEIMTLHQPTGWTLHRLGQLFEERKEKVSDKDYSPLSVTMSGIVPQLESAAKTDDGDNRKLVRAGDYVINSRSDRKGSGGISEYDGSVSLISIVLKPKGIKPRFAHHLLRSQAFQEEFYRWGHGIVADLWTTRFADMKNIRLFLPTLAKQEAIANFLDREIARIDQLIDKKQRLDAALEMRLLSNLKLAVLGGARVCRDTYARDWLVDLNPSWHLMPLKYLVRVMGGATPSKDNENYWNGEIPWVSPKDMKTDEITVTSHYISDEAVANSATKIIEEGAVLIVVRGMILARTLPVCRLSVDATINQDMKALLPKTNLIDGVYLQRMLQGFQDVIMSFVDEAAHGTKTLRSDRLFSLKFPVPPLSEQKNIVVSHQHELSETKKVRDTLATSIIRLKEFRSTLITAAVTGQIDIGTWDRSGTVDRRLDEIQEAMRA